jgi:type IV pilus assembly protein PilB
MAKTQPFITTTITAQDRVLLGEMLVSQGLINELQLRQALDQQRNTGEFLGEILVGLGFIRPMDLGPYLEKATGFSFVNLADYPIDMELARSVPEDLSRRKLLLAFGRQDNAVHVAMVDPLNLAVTDDLQARLGRPVMPFLALAGDLAEAINRVYDVKHKAQSVLSEIATTPSTDVDLTVDELVGIGEEAPIVRLVHGVLQAAVSAGTSDIHIEPHENLVKVRFRQDGLLCDQMTYPRNHLAAVVSRIKVMARLNIAERRRPQDGKFVYKDEDGNDYDMRVSILPLIYGEKVVMRVLPKASAFADMDRLGFSVKQRDTFEKFIHRPYGIVLVTGPTGSGKSTTLFAALNRINGPTLNINTIEDPVEYNLPGINQMQVNEQIGVSFAAGLRTLVRQDPDVIMVGEIRDLVTAEVAIQAALTGHLVFSTLHTNDAPGAMIRLQNMGVEPFLLSSAMIGVIGQRLMRTVCSNCKEWRPATKPEVEALKLPLKDGRPPDVAQGRGCPKCGGRGMKGRTGVYEMMPMSDPLRSMVLKRVSGAELRAQAISEGMTTMRESGVRKVLEGVTTPEEVVRVLYAEDF